MIKTVVFDIGKVLIGFEWGEYVRSLFDEETAAKVTHAMFGSRYWHELDRAVLSEEEILELFYETEPEYKAEIDKAFERVGECVTRRDWAIPLIESLKARGYRVLYLSNYSEYVMASNPSALDFLPHMDGGIFSCDEKVIKPDPEIYRRLIAKYDLVPERCLFIDDNPDNVDAARAQGLQSFVFEDYDQMCAALERYCGAE